MVSGVAPRQGTTARPVGLISFPTHRSFFHTLLAEEWWLATPILSMDSKELEEIGNPSSADSPLLPHMGSEVGEPLLAFNVNLFLFSLPKADQDRRPFAGLSGV